MKNLFFIFVLLGSLIFAYNLSVHKFAYSQENENNINIKEQFYFTPTSFDDSARYFPLKIGNKFYYKYKNTYHRSNPDSTAVDSSYYVSRITDTVRFYGKLYYKMNLFLVDTAIGYFRYDADSGFFMVYDTWGWCSHENKYFKFISVLNEMGYGSCLKHNIAQKCTALKDTAEFNLQRKLKTFYLSTGSQSHFYFYNTIFVKDIGLTQYIYSYTENLPAVTSTNEYNLIGAYVNGVKYGDTNTVGIKTIGNTVPDKFALYQNYPNPFNPSTNIKYQIANNKLVILKIYDILGKEVETLVNENQKPGTYEVTFDGSKLSSGIYFYTLTAGEYNETKKMVLIK